MSDALWSSRSGKQAYYDSLTQLANRVLFRDRVEHAVQRARRHHQPLVVMFLDLDNFKNDQRPFRSQHG
ncbi:MAG: diguanylate cyclase [Candidatus Competibacteraceae bacterium]